MLFSGNIRLIPVKKYFKVLIFPLKVFVLSKSQLLSVYILRLKTIYLIIAIHFSTSVWGNLWHTTDLHCREEEFVGNLNIKVETLDG